MRILKADGTVDEVADVPHLSVAHPLGTIPTYITQSFLVQSVTGILHRGVDFSCGYNPLYSVEDGRVVVTYTLGRDMPGLESDGSPGGYGNQVVVEHVTRDGFIYYSLYCHLSRVDVRYGNILQRGQQIGISGTTGISTGTHLHFELRYFEEDGTLTRFDPVPFINKTIEYTEEEILEMAFDANELTSLHKLAALDINGLTFAPGTPGRSLLMLMMDTYKALPDDEARKKFDRRFKRLLTKLGSELVSPAVEVDDRLVTSLSRPV